jgi:hypothetical protein
MKTEIKLSLPPEIALDQEKLYQYIRQFLHLNSSDELNVVLQKRSIDARRSVKVHLTAMVYVNEQPFMQPIERDYKNVQNAPHIHIIGAGPGGLFAALQCIELGFKPVVFERGKNVRDRRRDLAAINKKHTVNPESNYCFGEGGAGTYSDGKLYTRSKKRGDVHRILETLVYHGAKQDILVDSHPHIGTNKLPKVIEAIRNTILNCGGEIHFNTKVTDFDLNFNKITHIYTSRGEKIPVEHVILATGHSARDVFELLHRKNILIEPKPFAMGLRVEHPQNLIDRIQYKRAERGDYLPAASYSLRAQIENRGVFSFCMCPGGFIVPAATNQEEVVVNGMSPSKRDSKYANSGIVVAVNLEDLPIDKEGVFAGLKLQKLLEKNAWVAGGKTQTAPAQRLTDFVHNKLSATLPDCSYQPGLKSTLLSEVLPPYFYHRLQKAFVEFDKKMKGYLTEDAVLVGVESRTSSPVKIPRDKEKLHHVQITNLYPCAEGAGYAGGIVSAAIDGEKCAVKCVENLKAWL